ncbi:MAG: histidine phosphatase family protein [Cyclobacteriaceae bacterium]|nr:histidine phosphatase family protein [Cyclobacteriaceae bacterium]
MKTLYLVRHAKSSWADPDQADFERPLNERGKRDAPRMAKRLKEKEIHPDLIFSSPAKRALSTSKRMAKILKYPKDGIKTDQKLYHASDDTLLSMIQNLKDKFECVVIVGHNPGLTDFVNSFLSEELDIDNIPTCGVVAFKLEIDAWSKATWGIGKMLFFDYPKSKED